TAPDALEAPCRIGTRPPPPYERSPRRLGRNRTGSRSSRSAPRPKRRWRSWAWTGTRGGRSQQLTELEQVAEARLDRDPARRPRDGEMQVARHHREQVVAGHRELDLGRGILTVDDVHDGAVVQPGAEVRVEVADVAARGTVQVDLCGRLRVARESR